MLNSKRMNLRPLLESKDGIHLTAYLLNRGDLIDLKLQLRKTIEEAYEYLAPVLTVSERDRFLEPLDKLMHDARIFGQMQGNIGLFRNEKIFRVLNIPIDVERSCQVATTFHVKPVLRWLQADAEFLLLGLEKDAAHLFAGSQTSFRRLDSALFSEVVGQEKAYEPFEWLEDWIREVADSSSAKIFLAGERLLVGQANKALSGRFASNCLSVDSFSLEETHAICEAIRRRLRDEAAREIQKSILEFRFAEDEGRIQKNIFQISKAVVQGKVRKLIVTDDLSIFGKIDLKSGLISLHPFDLDHEDDCVLDDLAQMVLSQGGEVVIAKRDEIPKGRPILAIIDDENRNRDKRVRFQILPTAGGAS